MTFDLARLALITSLATGVVAAPAMAFAQSETEAVTSLDELVVTAEKRGAVSVLKTPLSVSVFGGQTLEDRGVSSMVDVLQSTPGVGVFQFQPGQNFIQIRGISATTGDATTGYYLDDLPFTLVNLSYVPDVDPFDLQRVEVLRGPQGTLYGASSEGGAVRILTNNADPSRFDARAGVEASSTADGGANWGAQGVLNLPIVKDKLALRLSGDWADDSGFIDNPVLGQDDVNSSTRRSLRAKLTLRPTEGLEIRAMVWNAAHRTDSALTSDDQYRRFSAIPEHYDTDMDLYNLAVQYDTPWGQLYSATSKIRYQIDNLNGEYGFPFGATARFEAVNEELRFTSAFDGPFQLTAGAFYLSAKEDLQSAAGAFVFQTDRLKSEQWAVFGEGRYQLTDRLTATLGLRYFEDQRSYHDRNPNNTATLALLGVPAQREAQFTSTSPRFNLSYRFGDDGLAYLNIAKGFRSGLSQLDAILLGVLANGVPAPVFVDAESLWSYEVGIKAPLLDRTLAVQVAGYWNDWRDLQVNTTTLAALPGGAVPVTYIQNVGGAHAVGLDVELIWTGVRGLTLTAGANVNHSVYDEDLPGISGIFKGDRIANVPRLTLSAAADYTWPIGGEGLEGVVHAAVTHNSARPDYADGVVTRSGELTFLSLRLGVQNERWGLFATGENLLDERDKTENLVALGALHAHPRPRTIGIAAKIRY